MKNRRIEVTVRKGKAFAAYLQLCPSSDAKVARTTDAGNGLRVDYDDQGVPMGIDVTSPGAVTIAQLDALLSKLGLDPLTAEEWALLDPSRTGDMSDRKDMQSHNWTAFDRNHIHSHIHSSILECTHCGALALIVSNSEGGGRPDNSKYLSTILCFAGMRIYGGIEWLEARPAPVIPWYCHDTIHVYELDQINQVMTS